MGDDLGDLYFTQPSETNIYANEFGVIVDEDLNPEELQCGPNNTTRNAQPQNINKNDIDVNNTSIRYKHQPTEEGIYDELDFENDSQCIVFEISKEQSPKPKACNHYKTWLIIGLVILVFVLGGALLLLGLTPGSENIVNNQGSFNIEFDNIFIIQ